MPQININTQLKFHDGTYLVTEVEASLLRLRNCATGEYSMAHVADLPRRLVEPPRYPDVDPRTLDPLSQVRRKGDRKKLDRLAAHIEEMMTGQRPDGTQPRPEYDPRITPVGQRLQNKSAELKQLGLPASIATLKRKRKSYSEGGFAGLVDGRETRKANPFPKLSDTVRDALIRVIEAETEESTGTTKRLITRLRVELLRSHPGFDLTRLPSESTLYRYADFYSSGRYTTGDAQNRRSAAHTQAGVALTKRRMHPGQEVQIDSTTFDAFALTSDGRAEHPTLTVMVDVATRSIIASTFRFVAATGVDHAFLLAQALTPRQNRPGHKELWELVRLLHPEAQLSSEEDRQRAENSRPFIYPERIIMDNGMDFRGTVFEAACLKFKINTTLATPDRPIDKPHVERLFGTIKRNFSEDLPGYTGGSVNMRGHRPEEDELLTLPALAERFEEWVAIVYQNEPHEGLRIPTHPKLCLTPNQMYRVTAALSGQVPVPLDESDFIGLLKRYDRVITSEGIQIEHLHYNSPELQLLRRLPSNEGTKSHKWEVRANPYNPRLVWVRHPDGGWIECVWREDATFTQPFAASIWRDARRIAVEEGVGGDEEKIAYFARILSLPKRATLATRKQRSRRDAAFEQAAAEQTPMPSGSGSPELHPPLILMDLSEDDELEGYVPFAEGQAM